VSVSSSARAGRLRAGELAHLASRLTDRDRQIANDCYEHRVLTTEQLRRLHFTDARSATRRLHALHELRVLERFRPTWRRGEGSNPYHWILDTAGAYVVAAIRGLERHQLAWKQQPLETVAGSATLAHRRATNEFATRLIAQARATGATVPEWRGERGAGELLDGIVIPDSYLALEHPTGPLLHLLLEIDRATEDHARLLTKARRYAKAIPRSPLRHANTLVLLITPTARRACSVAATLTDAAWPIAVAAWGNGDRSPLEIVQRASRGSPPDNAHADLNSF
jgi:hypothetical protein